MSAYDLVHLKQHHILILLIELFEQPLIILSPCPYLIILLLILDFKLVHEVLGHAYFDSRLQLTLLDWLLVQGEGTVS